MSNTPESQPEFAPEAGAEEETEAGFEDEDPMEEEAGGTGAAGPAEADQPHAGAGVPGPQHPPIPVAPAAVQQQPPAPAHRQAPVGAARQQAPAPPLADQPAQRRQAVGQGAAPQPARREALTIAPVEELVMQIMDYANAAAASQLQLALHGFLQTLGRYSGPAVTATADNFCDLARGVAEFATTCVRQVCAGSLAGPQANDLVMSLSTCLTRQTSACLDYNSRVVLSDLAQQHQQQLAMEQTQLATAMALAGTGGRGFGGGFRGGRSGGRR